MAAPVAAAPSPLRDPIPPTPANFAITPWQAVKAADRAPDVVDARRQNGPLSVAIAVVGEDRWELKYFGPADADGILHQTNLVVVDAETGAVVESWVGIAVAWPLARGREGQFGHLLNAPYVWLPLCALFLALLIDFRQIRQLAHLDLLVLLSFGIGHIFFNNAQIGASVVLAYPPLIYLMIRAVSIGRRGNRPTDRLKPPAPSWVFAVALVVLLAGRIVLNTADSGVIDVGYAGVIGADRISHGEPIYGESTFPEDNPRGDTYGPAAYLAYVPFEAAFGWSGSWDDLPAAHAAAIFFDLATVAGLLACGARFGSRRVGLIAGFAWVAFPYTTFALQANSNDSLVSALVVWGLFALASPLARGVLVAIAALTKFAPLALVPLFLAGRNGAWGDRRRFLPSREAVLCAAAAIAISAFLLAGPAIEPGLGTFWDRTIANQAARQSPFSIWGWFEIGPLRTIVEAIVAVAIVMPLLRRRRRRTPAQIAALAAALLIAAELTVEHWFYLYIPWFYGPLLVALTLPAAGSTIDSIETARPRSSTSTQTALTHGF